MKEQEHQQLTAFLQQLSEAQAIDKDPEADTLVRAACARQADAAYLLVARAMLLEQALRHAQDEVARLQEQLAQMRSRPPATESNASFLNANAWGNSPAAPLPPIAPSAAGDPAPRAVPAASAWGSGMLGTMATTAAGVVAGGFLFQGIEHLLGSANRERSDAQSNGATSPAIDPALDSQFGSNSGGNSGGEFGHNKAATDLFDSTSLDDYIAGDTDNADSGT